MVLERALRGFTALAVFAAAAALTWYLIEPETWRVPAERPLSADPGCMILMPESPNQPVPGLPTGVAFHEFETKSAALAVDERERLLQSLHGRWVAPGTECAWIEVGPVTSQARLVTGERPGAVFFFRTSWTGRTAKPE